MYIQSDTGFLINWFRGSKYYMRCFGLFLVTLRSNIVPFSPDIPYMCTAQLTSFFLRVRSIGKSGFRF